MGRGGGGYLEQDACACVRLWRGGHFKLVKWRQMLLCLEWWGTKQGLVSKPEQIEFSWNKQRRKRRKWMEEEGRDGSGWMDGDKWHYSLWDSRHSFSGVGTSSSPDPRWAAPAVLECHFLLCLRHCIATQHMHCLFPQSNQFTITTYPALKVVGVAGFYPSCQWADLCESSQTTTNHSCGPF